MGKKVAITGVNSYFASTILPHLEADPEIESIIGIDVSLWKGGYKKVVFHRADIRSEEVFEILKGVDVLYHLAFVVSEIKDKEKTRDININGTRNIFQACIHNKVGKVIYTSSMTAYGAHKDNPPVFTEDSRLARNDDNYYNTSKVEVEEFAAGFFENHPEIIFTTIRAALLCGPGINNMFSKLWSLPVGALSLGSKATNQFIHEDDLGQALYLCYQQDLPGVYNVTADDSVATSWCFQEAGVIVIPLPTFLLKPVADLAFKIGLFPASGAWVCMSEHTIFGSSAKFKKATGWQPRYTSEQTFRDYQESSQRDRKDGPFRALLSWGFKQGVLLVGFFKGLDLLFQLGRIPGVRNVFPWTDPEKNSMTYLPVNESLKENADTVLPPQVLSELIEKASIHYRLDHCGCRLAHKCQQHTHEVGCMFMGESALKLPAGIGRRISKEEALKHADRAMDLGLVPMTGKVRVDNSLFFVPDEKKLLTVCFCCDCCCMMGYLKHTPAEHLDQVMRPIEGLTLEVTDACNGCGTCVEHCIFEAISIEQGRAVHNGQCRGCGRCERFCPHGAVKISINNPDFKDEVIRRIESHVDFS